MSRKSMLGLITGRAGAERIHASVAAHVLAVRARARASCACTTSPRRVMRSAVCKLWRITEWDASISAPTASAARSGSADHAGVRHAPGLCRRRDAGGARKPACPGERPAVLIGKDTRISGYMLEAALEAGFAAAGVDVMLCGPMPTPAVAYLTRALRLQAGVVISASHNPVRRQRHQVLFGAGHQAARRGRARDRGAAGTADGLHGLGQGSARRAASTTPPGATSSSARAPSPTTSTCAA
jgi:hypothetical protein